MDNDENINEKEHKEENEIKNNDSSNNESRILDSADINDTEHSIIKGDTVGQTLYSERWILQTLIAFAKVDEDSWNESIENDLCMLWDMTAEKDIVEFLLDNNFFHMAPFTLIRCNEPRLTEITIGIIGNMCCVKKALDELVNSEQFVSYILSLMNSNDTETLIQVLRILQAALWDIQKNEQSQWLKIIEECKFLGQALCFILKSSTNVDLLTPTIDLVYLISDTEIPNKNFFEGVFVVDQLICALCDVMLELLSETNNPHSDSQHKNIDNWFNIIFYLSENDLLSFSDIENDENFIKMNDVLLRILEPYTSLSNLTTSDDKCFFHIKISLRMVLSFQRNELIPKIKLTQSILMIMVNLKAALTGSDFESNIDTFKEIFEYSTKNWVETLNIINNNQILEIFQICTLQTTEEIIRITESLQGVSETSANELKVAKEKIFGTNLLNGHE